MKIGRYVLVLTLCSFCQGLLAPILSLLLLDKGMTLSHIGLGMALYSVTAVVLEVPSGIDADMLGKKRVFLLSLMVTAIACMFLLAGNGPVWTLASLAMYGAGRALSTGTLDALFISRCQQAQGADGLPKGMKVLSLCESLGLAAGAILGGILPAVGKRLLPMSGSYDFSLILRIFLSFAVILLALFFIPADAGHGNGEPASLRRQLKQGFFLVRGSENLKSLFIAAIGLGFVLSLLEVYWQPRYLTMLGGKQGHTVYLGILSVAYFAAISGGSMLAEKWLSSRRMPKRILFLLARGMMVLAMVAAAITAQPILFAICYCLLYFLLGVSNVAEGSVFHREVPDSHRASFLSAQSLLLQCGSLTASFAGSAVVEAVSISGLWLMGAGMAALFLLPMLHSLMGKESRKEKAVEVKDA